MIKWFLLLAMGGIAGCASAPPSVAHFSTLPPPTPPLIFTSARLTAQPQTVAKPFSLALTWDNFPGMNWDVYLSDDLQHWSLMGHTVTNWYSIPHDNPYLFFTVVTVSPINGQTSNLPPP